MSQKIDVAVVALSSLGETELHVVRIEASAAEVQEGGHLDAAKARLREQGYEPVHAFDEKERAFRTIRERDTYQRFFRQAVSDLQDCLVPDREAGGADTVELVCQLFARFPKEVVYIGFSASDGYWNNDDGFAGTAAEASVCADANDLTSLVAAAPVVAIPLRLRELEQLSQMPDFDKLGEDVQEALDALEGEGRDAPQDLDAAIELVRKAAGSTPSVAAPILEAVARHLVLREHERSRQTTAAVDRQRG